MSALRAAAKPGVPVTCAGTCGRTWPQDPPFEVACPNCGASPGTYCQRPGGHAGPFVAFHAARDLAAFEAGAYGGPCSCADDAPPAASVVQADLFTPMLEAA